LGPDGGILRAPGGYYVAGNTVYDTADNPHLFRGLDRPSMEWDSAGNITEADYLNMSQLWNANVVRLTLNQDYWLEDPNNPNYDPHYQNLVDQQVKWAEQYGMDIILDLHWSDQGDYSKGCPSNCTDGCNCQQCMADAHSVIFWQQVATKYKGDGHVLFELYNEPFKIPWGVWLNGGQSVGCTNNGGSTPQSFTVVGMQQLYNTVRATGAENLVIIGGLNWAYDLTGVPGNRVQGHNIIYNTHPYSSKCGGRTNQNACTPANYDAEFGFLAATDPIIATEFGDSDCSAGFYQTFTQYAQSKGIHWTGWAYFVGGCGFPSLISDDNGTPIEGSGTTVQAALLSGGTHPRPEMEAGPSDTDGGVDGAVDGGDGAVDDSAPGDDGGDANTPD
jgi:aryl-phospho-beta-D-glucosidase BglC (GH1 family)